MKKVLLTLTLLMLTCMAAHAQTVLPQNLTFTPQGGGKFIYCNNDEAIWRKDLSDDSNPNPMYIMNNDDLGAGKYAVFISHVNHTDSFFYDGSIKEMGFDIEVDVQFVAKADTTIVFTAAGFDVQRLQTYSENGIEKKTQSPWDLIDAWADYLQLPVYTINSDAAFIPRVFSPVRIDLRKGEEVWLSRYIDNYSTVTFLRAVHILADFEIEAGAADVNVAALKHNGILKDRSHHSKNAKRGIYYRDRQYKGIADTLPAVNANLNYTLDDTVASGTFLPVRVFNQYVPAGSVVTKWHTNINPQEDIWSRSSCAESDMLSFKYYDEEKLKYYSSSVAQEQKDAVWVFDVFHSDTKESPGGIPNYKLSAAVDNRGNGCNLGNYGVRTNYHVTITNQGSKTRYFNYNLTTVSTNLVILKDSNGNIVNNFAARKKATGEATQDTMASVALLPNTSATFTIEVILPPNCPGGMVNAFEISDTAHSNVFYQSNKTEITAPYPFTGREYIKWYGGDLYGSDDSEAWVKKEISDDARRIFDGNWNNFEIKYTQGIYVVRWQEYDEAPHFYNNVLRFCNRVYYFDEAFNLLATHYFEGYPSEIAVEDDKIVTTADGRRFETTLPGLEKTITVKLDTKIIAFDVNPIIENGRTLVPIRAFFEAMGAKVDWDEQTSTAKITAGRRNIAFTIGSGTALVDGQPQSMDVPPCLYNSRTLVPLRFMSENLGYHVVWDDLTKTVTVTSEL